MIIRDFNTFLVFPHIEEVYLPGIIINLRSIYKASVRFGVFFQFIFT